jgi:hypothetical protein
MRHKSLQGIPRKVEGTFGLLSTLPVMAQKCAKRTVLERPISCPFNANRERRRRALAALIGLDVLPITRAGPFVTDS